MSLYDTISSELQGMLTGLDHSVEALSADTSPLFMLLTIGRDKAAFALLDGQAQENYENAVEQLRRLYASHATEWVKFELNLVLCQSNEVPHDFHTKVEVDPYFCRKFIIDPSQLDIELRRLPFIPLSILKQISERPVNAQTLLIRHGVSPEVARYIVVPHAKGNERIIEECLRGDWGVPERREYSGKSFVGPATIDTSAQVRLRHLEISGFRAYREKLHFDLDADVVVLFGPNGFGKTSFFDAIDFACTGSVARFDERFGRDVQRLMKSLKNLRCSLQDCYVSATLAIDGKEVTIKRCLTDRTKVSVDGDTELRKQTLLRVAGLSGQPSETRVENLIRLFRATHLFGQEYQSLTCDFRRASTLSEDVVSRMLALQDYVQAIEKTSQIAADLHRQVQDKKSRIASLEDDLGPKQSQLDELRKLSKSLEQPQVVTHMAREMAVRVVKAGITVEDSPFDEKTARGWRSLVTMKIVSLEHSASIANEILNRHPEYENCSEKLTETLASLGRATKSLDDVTKTIKVLQEKFVSANALVERKLGEEKIALLEKDNLDWLLTVRTRYIASVDKFKELSLVHNDTADKLTNVSSRLAFMESQRESLLSEILGKRTQNDNLRKNIEDLNRLRAEIGQWRSCVEQEKVAVGELQALDGELTCSERDVNVKQGELLAAEKRYSELASRLQGMQDLQSELQQLLHNLEGHIVNNTCPTCGASYDSKDELIERLRKCRGSESEGLTTLRQAHKEAKLEYEKLRITVSEAQDGIQGSKQKHENAAELLAALRDRVSQYQQRLSAFGIKATAYDAGEAIDSEKKRILDLISVMQRKLDDLLAQVARLDTELAELKKERDGLSATIQEIVARQEALKTLAATISQEALDRKVSVVMTEEAVGKRLSEIQLLIQANQRDSDLARAEASQARNELNPLEVQSRNLQNQVNDLSVLRDNQTRFIDDVRKLAAEIGLTEVKVDKIRQIGSQFSQQLGELNELLADLTSLETALNNAEMSITTSRISKEKTDLEQILQSEKQVLGKLDLWRDYFQRVREELEHIRSQALGKYVQSYGPLSSCIQKRLRSVYGFGDVSLRVHEGTIIAEVESSGYAGLSPSDYFSESQIQIAMLSLFLSANLTQNWSRFCPVLLDDPVEHFDDLNSYALVGLIKRLASRGLYGRQFIISTCDERLYRLMRQQFNTMDGKVAYHRFSALGEKGPVIDHLIE